MKNVLLAGLLTLSFPVMGHEDLFNLDLIYNDSYNFSLPREILESYLSGNSYDYKQYYTDEESAKLREDISEIYQEIMHSEPLDKPLAVMTAGAPGSGKTFKMREDLKKQQGHYGKSIAYICPDDVCLKRQTRTYLVDIAEGDGSFDSWKAAYDKWRPGSNAATHLVLAHLIRQNKAFYFGTTSSSPGAITFFEHLKKQGYHIRLLHITAPDDVRWESIKERDKSFVQTTEEDIRLKGFLVPQRINDTFLKFADEIEFYYRDGIFTSARLAAKWINKGEERVLEIINLEDYEKIKSIHNSIADELRRPDIQWQETVERL